jgi:putative transposase
VRRRTHKARLYPTPSQAAALDRQRNTARALWNLLHEWHTCRHGGIARRPSIAEMDRQLRDARVNPLPGWTWLADLPAQATQQVLKRYLNAWNRYFSGVSKPPKFKKSNARMAVDAPQASALKVARLNRHWGDVRILLVGRVRFRWTRPLPGVSWDCPGRITGAQLVKDQLGWHICFRIEEPAVVVPSNAGPPVGVDRGVIHTMALSNGEMLDMRFLLSPGEERRLRGLERKAARQQLANAQQDRDPSLPISKRQCRTYEQIAALRARQARRRQDWLHKTTTDLAKSHGVVVVEDLHVRNLIRSARGTAEQPGSNVRAKAGLNRSILAMAWGKAGRMLTYKSPLYGGVLVRVDPRNSSVECARCGHASPTNRVSQATFRCVVCRHEANADTNAAQVLLERGLTALSGAAPGCGGTAREARFAVPHREPLLTRTQHGEVAGTSQEIPHTQSEEDIKPTSIFPLFLALLTISMPVILSSLRPLSHPEYQSSHIRPGRRRGPPGRPAAAARARRHRAPTAPTCSAPW